jgi:DoxX-like family
MMKRWLPWIGWLLSIGAVSILLMSARWKLTFDPWYVKEWGRIGWDPSMLPRIALIQLACIALYLTPQTAVLGAVLLTGYLGGAISQYTRLEEPTPFWSTKLTFEGSSGCDQLKAGAVKAVRTNSFPSNTIPSGKNNC